MIRVVLLSRGLLQDHCVLHNVIRPAVCSWSPSSKRIERKSSSLFEKKKKAT